MRFLGRLDQQGLFHSLAHCIHRLEFDHPHGEMIQPNRLDARVAQRVAHEAVQGDSIEENRAARCGAARPDRASRITVRAGREPANAAVEQHSYFREESLNGKVHFQVGKAQSRAQLFTLKW